MRFTGDGIGHYSIWEAGSKFRQILEGIFGKWYRATESGVEADIEDQDSSDGDVEEENVGSESEEDDDDEEDENEDIDPELDDGEPEIDEEILGFGSF